MKPHNPFSDLIPRLTTALFLITAFFLMYFYAPLLLSVTFICILIIILLYEWPYLAKPKQLWVLTPFYPITPFIILVLLNQSPERRLIIFMFILSALFDSGGYFIGKIFGNHPLAPTISPYKTWEGLLGSFTIAWVAGPFLMQILQMHYLGWLTLPFITIYCFLAFIGGIFVSWLKRRANIKDSSNLLPGHGGLLDRFDSIMLSSIFIYCIKTYII
jgi:phosphatidate cytidylyltransferase